MNPPQQFTAARVAEILGKSPRVVRRWLSGITPDGKMMVRGNLAACWNVESLPSHIIMELTATANAKGFRYIDNLLSGRIDAWQPEIPWNEICPDQQAEALAIQRALMPLIQRRNESGLSVADFETLGVQTYQRDTGKETTRERWRYIFNRTIERDGGAEQFHRPELFLNGNLRKKIPTAPALGLMEEFAALNAEMGNFGDELNPSIIEIDKLWKKAAQLFVEASKTNNRKKLKRRLLDFLWVRAPFLAKSPNALRVNFDRRLKLGDDPNRHADGRAEKRGIPTANPYNPEQLALIKITTSDFTGGRRAQAVRELNEAGLITDPRIKRSIDKQTSKSALPASLRKELKDIPAWEVMHLGDRAAKKMVPPAELSYDRIFSMTALVGDDGTPNNYVCVPNESGWYDVMRPQLIVIVDFRSLRILSRAIVPRPQYSALDVAGPFKRIFKTYGLPKFILREGGIWRKSKAVNQLAQIGSTNPPRRLAEARREMTYSPSEIEFGLERKGVVFCDSMDQLAEKLSSVSIAFRESYQARTKPVERVIGMLWDLMDKLPGFCGRNEKIDCPQETRKAVDDVINHRRTPAEAGLMEWQQWVSAVEAVIAKFNAAKQEGRRLRNPLNGEPLSPDEAFEVFGNLSDPPNGFGADGEILLSRPPIEVAVKKPNLRKRQFPCGFVRLMGNTYCDEQTGSRVGQSLLAFYDPEAPETCTFTDLNRRNHFTVARLEPMNALYPDEQTAITRSQANRAIAPIKADYKATKEKFAPLIRQALVSPLIRNLNAHVVEQAQKIEEAKKETAIRASTRIKRARTVGLQPAALRGDAMGDEGLDMMQRALATEEKKSKTYVLDPHKTFTPKNNGGNQ